VLCGIALALSLVDSAVSLALFPLPGFKLGLANVVSLFAVYTPGLFLRHDDTGGKEPYSRAALRQHNHAVFLAGGGRRKHRAMWALKKRLSIIKTSVTGSVCHNTVQVFAAMAITSTPQVAYYIPVLAAAGSLSGFAMGALCTLVIERLKIRIY
jgi:heptaprenyl diphosphate synthase